jgi:plastocyanin
MTGIHITPVRIFVALLAAFGLALLMTPLPARADEPVKLTVKVTDQGFDPAVVEVPQGAPVELTFVFANKNYPQDEHIMVGTGAVKFESDKIDSATQQTTVKFVATQPGTFGFKCNVECDAHDDLQKGEIKVKAAGGAAGAGASSGLQESKLTIDPTAGVLVKGNSVSIVAVLQDKDGKPISKADVTFYLERQFLGRKGQVEIATAKTNEGGLATAVYRPTDSAGGKITVAFAGGGLYDKTEESVQLAPSRQFEPLALAAKDDDLHGLKRVAPYALITLIGGIWLGFAFMLYLAWGISRAAPGGDSASHV